MNIYLKKRNRTNFCLKVLKMLLMNISSIQCGRLGYFDSENYTRRLDITPGQSLSLPLEIWSRTSLGFMTGLAILIVTDSPKVLVISIKVDIKPQLDHSLTVIILLCKTGVSQMTKCKT